MEYFDVNYGHFVSVQDLKQHFLVWNIPSSSWESV